MAPVLPNKIRGDAREVKQIITFEAQQQVRRYSRTIFRKSGPTLAISSSSRQFQASSSLLKMYVLRLWL